MANWLKGWLEQNGTDSKVHHKEDKLQKRHQR